MTSANFFGRYLRARTRYIARPTALYLVGPTLQRHALADLLGLNDDAISDVTELVRLGILVEQPAADQVLAAVVDEVAKRGRAVAVGAFEVPRSAALTVEADVEQLLIVEKLLVLLAIDGRLRIVHSVLEDERLRAALDNGRDRPGGNRVAIPVRLHVELDRGELGRCRDRWRMRDNGRRRGDFRIAAFRVAAFRIAGFRVAGFRVAALRIAGFRIAGFCIAALRL